MNREAEFAAKSLPDQLRSITNEALWDHESAAIEAAADALVEAEGLIAYLKGDGREHGAWDLMKKNYDEALSLAHRYANQATNAETERDDARALLAQIAKVGGHCGCADVLAEVTE
jgi:predicted phage gp36 major capsid-like protein